MHRSLAPSRSLLKWFRALESQKSIPCVRPLSTSALHFSGHSRWSTIKHDKARNDGIKNKQRSAVSLELYNASKGGGPDPKANPRLSLAIANAKRTGMQKDTIEAAIMRGQGKSSSGAALESVTLEIMMSSVAIILDCETESKLRALQELRVLVKDAGGNEGQTAYMFERRGRIVFLPEESVTSDDVLEVALDLGAVDVIQDSEGRIIVDTEPSAIKAVEAALVQQHKLQVGSSEAIWVPIGDTQVESLEGEPRADLEELISQLEDYPGVQGVYTNLASRT